MRIIGCCLLLSIFLQDFVETKILSLADTDRETQNLVTSVDADDKIAKLKPFVKLITTDDEDDVTDDENDYDDIEGDVEQSFVKLIQEVADEADQRHARLTPIEEPERFSRLITDDEDEDGSDDEDGDNEVKETSEEDDDNVAGEDSKFVKKLNRHHRKNKAAKGKGRKCGRKCRGKGKGRKQNLVKYDEVDDKIARLEPFVKLVNPHKEEEVSDADFVHDIEGEDAEPSFVKLIQDVYNSYVSQEDDNENDQRIARLTPNEEATRFSKLITDEDEVEFNGFEAEKPDEDDELTDVETKLVQKLKRQHSHRRNKAAKGKGRKCGKKCGGMGKGRKPNWRQIVKKLKEATNERRNKKKHQQRHKNAAKEVKRCPRSSKVCCDGNAPNFDGDKSTPACKDGGKPQCSLEDCKYTLLETFATWF